MEAYLKRVKFEKRLKKLEKKLENKTAVVYAAGSLFKTALKNYDLSKLNIVGISDAKYNESQNGQEDLGFKIIHHTQISQFAPDYVLIGNLNFFNVMKSMYDNIFKGTKTKVIPLVDKPFWEIWGEI